jgi:hypothetical protein
MSLIKIPSGVTQPGNNSLRLHLSFFLPRQLVFCARRALSQIAFLQLCVYFSSAVIAHTRQLSIKTKVLAIIYHGGVMSCIRALKCHIAAMIAGSIYRADASQYPGPAYGRRGPRDFWCLCFGTHQTQKMACDATKIFAICHRSGRFGNFKPRPEFTLGFQIAFSLNLHKIICGKQMRFPLCGRQP